MEFSETLENIFTCANILAYTNRTSLVTPEHVLLVTLDDKMMRRALRYVAAVPVDEVKAKLDEYLEGLQKFPEGKDVPEELVASHQLSQLLTKMERHSRSAMNSNVDVPHMLNAMLELKDSFAANCLKALVGNDKGSFLQAVTDAYEFGADGDDVPEDIEMQPAGQGGEDPREGNKANWRDFVLCINDHLADHNPLIGRETELDRTVQVLCRKDKNNPLHIGEPGVGKTSIVYGLAQRIQDGNVPETLKDVKI